LISNVSSETAANIKAIYYDRDAFYLLSLPSTGFIYCFDTRAYLQDGSSRVTIWDSLRPKAFFVNKNKELLIGKPGYIGKYSGYSDNGTSYRFRYFTNYFDFDKPTQLKILKKIGFVVIGGSNDELAIKYGFDYSENYLAVTKVLDTVQTSEYNIASYTDPTDNVNDTSVESYYSGGIVLDKFNINVGGNGSVIQLGLESDINGNPLSIQKIDVFVKQGKTV